MKDRRHYKRFFIEGMGIHCRMLSGTEATLLGIHAKGAQLMLKDKVTVGSRHTLHVESTGLSISVQGIVESEEMNAAQDEFGPVYLVGLRFETDFAGEDDEMLTFVKANLDSASLTEKARNVAVTLVNNEEGGHHRGRYHVNEISFGGMSAEMDQQMELGDTLRMEIVFATNKPPILVTGRVASCEKFPNKVPVTFKTGIEFLDIREKDILKLKDLIYFIQEI
jgi:hypothetical protein